MDELILNSGLKDKLKFYCTDNREDMGKIAADFIAGKISELLKKKNDIRIIFASAPSQLDMLDNLIIDKRVDWSKITIFHMDEYLGLANDSDKSFKNFILNNISNKVKLNNIHLIDSENNPENEAERYSQLLNEDVIDIVCLGIGENGHIAFNDPHVADFKDEKTMKVVELDDLSRKQQVNDRIFEKFEDVPSKALTLTIPALISAESLFCTVPGKNKHNAIRNLFEGEVSEYCPASIMRCHKDASLFMDKEAYRGG